MRKKDMPSFWSGLIHPQPHVKRLKQLQTEVQNEAQYLSGRHSRLHELLRTIRISLEFLRGMRALHSIGPAITVFGSARFNDGHRYYQLAREVGAILAREGFTVITGGGPGIMEAANRGAQELGGHSIGCNILLPHEQAPNPYLDQVVTFYYFFVRKVMLIKYSYAFIILPGGMGTLDEMSEAITLIRTGKLYDFPVILMGTEYWQGYLDWINDVLVKNGAVSSEELSFIHMTDDPKTAIQIIQNAIQGLRLSLTPLKSTVD